VNAAGVKPFVFAARFPNGAVAIAAQERTEVANAWHMPPCDVTLSVSDAPGPFGVFGYFENLTLIFDQTLKGRRVLAQDLASDVSIDVTQAVRIRGERLELPGKMIRQVCALQEIAGDVSAPGLVIAID
jgi:hypothetical protein